MFMIATVMSGRLTFGLPAVVAFNACGGELARREPAKPYYEVSSMGVDTSATRVMDANGDLWSATFAVAGSQPLTIYAHATPAQQQRVMDAFSRLPAVNDPSCTSHTTLSYVAAGSTRAWTACMAGSGYAEPYADAIDAIGPP